MTTCPNLAGTVCQLAAQLAGADVHPHASACEFCSHRAHPAQAINEVVVSLALGAAGKERAAQIQQQHGHLLRREQRPPCSHFGQHVSTVPKDALECRCGEVQLHRCEHFRILTTARQIKPEWQPILQNWRAGEAVRSCVRCPAFRAVSTPSLLPEGEVRLSGRGEDPATFDRVFCINLDRRPDRWQAFQAAIPADWPFAPPIRVPAVDGQAISPPPSWTAGRGAWGCYRSHLSILERCLSEHVDSVLILEDDALPVPEFSRRAAEYLAALPPDWQMAYLGGQHLHQREHPPQPVNPLVVRPHNINRTHAYALRGEGLRIVYDWLVQSDWQPQHHIDHHLGRLHASGRIRVYAPTEWLVGQAAGQSNISGRDAPERFWDGRPRHSERSEEPRLHRPIIAVLGQFRSGSSCVAGILHTLGVSMGRRWATTRGNPRGTYEARMLARHCRQWFPEPACQPVPGLDRVAWLRRWLAGREASPAGVWGAKHPSLCLMVEDLVRAWPAVRFVALERPLEESVRSILSRRWAGWTRAIAEEVLTRQKLDRDVALQYAWPPRPVEPPDPEPTSSHQYLVTADQVLHLNYHALLNNPAEAVARLVAWAGISPTPEQIAAAVGSVDPQLRTVHVAA